MIDYLVQSCFFLSFFKQKSQTFADSSFINLRMCLFFVISDTKLRGFWLKGQIKQFKNVTLSSF